MKNKHDPFEVQRRVTLALTLEPPAEKPGCTTRTIDASDDLKLVYFQTAAINAGKYFAELTVRVNKSKGKQPVFSDLSLSALKN